MEDTGIMKDGNNGYVRTSEFDELKEMVATVLFELRRFGDKLDRVATDVEILKADVGELKADVGELKTDVGELKTDVGELKADVILIRRDVAGLSRSVSYALENEAYRELPKFLMAKYGIEMLARLIRVELKKDCEINILGEGTRYGKPVLIVGEAKLRLQGYYTTGISANLQMVDVFDQLERNVEAVRLQCKHVGIGADGSEKEIVRILITHFATADFLEEASTRGVIVVQSFEWQTG
ncbi:DNA repair ATPase [Candidatus Magnetobacterium bavaricum]|uniref:DNA repair ATPase n=1 Tax=Candidatus Magnetobacterium bavaricum TaxID=29290 RepID=A0A0F3GXX3_9BACT|nr:DNA repair ATPase [Candidatus Magnetobacterium bavaricum]